LFITITNSVGNWLKACYHTLLTPNQGVSLTGSISDLAPVFVVVSGLFEVVDVVNRV
jgi:hypothetical protein